MELLSRLETVDKRLSVMVTDCKTEFTFIQVQVEDASNKADIARFRLQTTTIRYNFSFDGYLLILILINSKSC